SSQFYEKISHDSGNEKNRFLNLPAPYHLLPDTPYFRRAPIVPPPTRLSLLVRSYRLSQKRISILKQCAITRGKKQPGIDAKNSI
uniref:Ovule protein n=1 Tax=Brugia timori TaxID=42155 RepID=A0A0R3Q9B2_9BILA